jgi:translation initiation factor eIF-2B subunit alpha
MHKVDMVLVGAEAVVENGGIVSRVPTCSLSRPPLKNRMRQLPLLIFCTHARTLQIGTYGIAIMAQAHKKPFYVAAESFKFTRLYPLNQVSVFLSAFHLIVTSSTFLLPSLCRAICRCPTVRRPTR